MPNPPATRDAITAALKECGPMSVPEIAEHLGMARNRINTCMTAARKNHPGRYFRIVRYRPQVGVSGRETPIYSASPGPDAPRPVFDVAQGRRDYYVPNDFLCHGDQGYGDYIIFKVDESGLIQGWKVPAVDPDEWE